MADLDDFFAKKDKKKKSKKFVTANTEVLATKLEENARKEHEADLKAVSAVMTLGDSRKDAVLEANDDEWKEYVENKDYSGLKIDLLKIDSDKEQGRQEEEENDETGEKTSNKKSEAGAWNKVVSSKTDDEESTSRPDTPEPKEVSEPAPAVPQKSAYVPPHMRGSALPAQPAVTKAGRRNKTAPDINNEINFPTLSAALADSGVTSEPGRSEATFEKVRASGIQSQTKVSEVPKLSLGNKFAALGE